MGVYVWVVTCVLGGDCVRVCEYVCVCVGVAI